MSEVNSDEEQEPRQKITEASPIKKGDFMTYSQLQKKLNSVIPDEETISYNTSALINSHLTYSMSQFEKSNLGKIEEVSESQNSFFSQLQQSQQHVKETEQLKLENTKQKQYIEELKNIIDKLHVCQKVEIDELQEKLEEKEKQITKLKQFEEFTKEQQKMIDQKDRQLKELKEQYDIRTTNLQQIIDDQTESIKTLHRQINLSQNSSQILSPNYYEKIKTKQTFIKQQFDELSKLYDEINEAPLTPSKKILSRTPSRSNHSHQFYNTEPKPLIM